MGIALQFIVCSTALVCLRTSMPFRKTLPPATALALSLLVTGRAAPADRVTIAQLTITHSLVIRIPGWRRSAAGQPAPGSQFKEHKGPHCIDAAAIGAAAISAPDGVDFIVKGGQRVRARLEEQCPALDYYSGFYVVPPPDGKICAGRDSIHTRSGGDCQVDRFRTLTPVAPLVPAPH
jgi:hypothetical protein